METTADDQPERLTVSRIHAVLAAISVGMIGQLTSVDSMSSSLHSATWLFASAIALNLTVYLLEADHSIPGVESHLLQFLVSILVLFAWLTPLFGMGYTLEHLSSPAGLLFIVFGGVLIVGHFVRAIFRLRASNKRNRAIYAECLAVMSQMRELQEHDGGGQSEAKLAVLDEKLKELDRHWIEIRRRQQSGLFIWKPRIVLFPPPRSLLKE